MQRISTSTKSTDLFGAGKHGFKDGNQSLGISPTDFNAEWCNQIQEEIANAIEAAGVALSAGNRSQLIDALIKKGLQQGYFNTATAGGTGNAITATFTPAITTLTNGLLVRVRMSLANTSTTPTFKADSTVAKTIVKGSNEALLAGDISGSGHWLELQYDSTLDKWVLLNPANGVKAGVGSGKTAYANVTASRAIGTIYTNTTGAPLHVAITVQTAATLLAGCRLLIGGQEVDQFYAASANPIFGGLQGVVPPGATYQVTNASGSNTLSIWEEL